MSENKAPQDVRDGVSAHYTLAVTQGSGCCAGSDCSPFAEAAGYGEAQIDGLPADAIASSFGCGNPVAWSEVAEGDVVLDLGSGAGIDLLLAARRVGATGKVIGVDMTPAMIEAARANIEQAGLQGVVEVRQGLIEELPIEDGTVDHVISNCVINLSPEKDKVFAEIARVLKPGGRISISDIVAENLDEAIRNSPLLHSSCIGGAISEDAYRGGLETAGLEQVEVADRIVHDEQTVGALVESEVKGLVSSCCGGELSDDELSGLSEQARGLVGNFWSARFVGRKPQ
jgi:arsenite methyltransferase